MTEKYNVTYPAQCECGHLFLEKYQFDKPNKFGEIGFCWCGFCQTKVMIKPNSEPLDKKEPEAENGKDET